MEKLHYFDDPDGAAERNDVMLQMAIGQGYVPKTCLLAGRVVMSEVNAGRDACAGCEGPREVCKGRPK
jgi:hypothetical protein